MNHRTDDLTEAMRAFNDAERTDFMLNTATRWLGLDGPAYILGDVRAKALFEDIHGRHWVDSALVVESLSGLVNNPGLLEGYRQLAASIVDADDLWVCTDERGKWNAVMAPVDVLAHQWGYPPPVLLPERNWARTWWDMPERTDERELAWIASGGTPTQQYGRTT